MILGVPEPENFNDPKKQFLVKLVNMVDAAGWLLANGEYGRAMSVLAVLLGRIDINDDYKKLQDLQRMVVEDYENFRTTPADVRIYFHQVSDYMNKTYFKEIAWATPRILGEGHLK